MARSVFPVFLATALLAASCARWGEEEKIPVPFTLAGSSAAFSKKELSLSIDSVSEALVIALQCQVPYNAGFPVNAAYKDTLTETAFLFELKADGQPVWSEYNTGEAWQNSHGGAGQMGTQASVMAFRSDTIDLRYGITSIQIPYYAFHRLKHGAHNMELSISQRVFRSNHSSEITYYDSVFKHPSRRSILNHAEKQMAFTKAHFMLHVPLLYQTVLYSNRIELKNDSTFNPYTSDNTLWKSSLPDIYWAVFYPIDHYYTSSNYETSTMTYTTPDTVNLYHYGMADKVGFAVYDHDNLSRDDGLGYGSISLKDIIKKKKLNASFGHVKLFSVRADYKGVVNP